MHFWVQYSSEAIPVSRFDGGEHIAYDGDLLGHTLSPLPPRSASLVVPESGSLKPE